MKQQEVSQKRRGIIKEKILELIKTIPIDSHICKQINISRSTLYRWLENDTEFRREFKDAKLMGVASVNDIAESKLIKLIQENNVTALIFWLKYHRYNYVLNERTRELVKQKHELTEHESFNRHFFPEEHL